MNKFYEEVLVSSDPDRGIQFTDLLMTLAHYKVINDNKSLRLQEFLRRRARLQRVDEAVRRNIVIGFFDTVYWSRRFRHHMERKNAGVLTAVPQFTVPEIFVEHDDDDDDHGDHGGAAPGPSTRAADPFADEPASPRSARRSRAALHRADSGDSIQLTPAPSPPRRPRPGSGAEPSAWQLGASGGRGDGPLEVDEGAGGGARSRAASNVSAQDVLDVLDNSAWGESIRRSFSMRRPSWEGRRE